MIAPQDSWDLDLRLPDVTIVLKSTSVFRSNILRAYDEPGEDHHHWFWHRDSLVGSESPGEHYEIVGEHGAVHVGFEVIESLPVTA